MSHRTSDLPFGSEFSPLQIESPALLDLIKRLEGGVLALEASILARYFPGLAAINKMAPAIFDVFNREARKLMKLKVPEAAE